MAMDSFGERPEASWTSARRPRGHVLRWQGRRTTGALRLWTARNSNKCRQTSVLINDPIPFASVRIGPLNAAVIAILPMAGSLGEFN